LGNADFDFGFRIFNFPIKREIQKRISAFYWEIQNPKSEIEIRISQSNAPLSLVFRYVTRDIFIVFKPGVKNGENIKPTKIIRKEKIDNSNP